MIKEVLPPEVQGIVSTQLDRIQNEKAIPTEAAKPKEKVVPPPPPPETGRGTNVDKSA